MRSARYTGAVPRTPELLVLALDIGSSSTRTALFDEHGKRLDATAAAQEYTLTYRADGAAELDAQKLYRAVRNCVEKTLTNRRTRTRVAAVCASGFWHGLLGLDRNRKPITPILMWADSRSSSDAEALRETLDERAVHARTGCMLRAPFWPAKLMWLRRTQPALFRRAKFWISPADWILEKLFGSNGTSASMASATGLLNIDQQTWDEELCSLTGIEPKSLGAFETGTEATRGLPGVTILTAIGDGAASNLGCGADRAGVFAINVGTSAAVRTICSRGAASTPFGLFRYVLDEKADVIGGAVSNAGNLRRWCVRELQLGDDRAVERALDRARAANNPLSVIPHWVQERAPDWPHDTGAVISGVRQSTTASDIFAAATCGVFYRLATIVDLLEKPFGRAGEIILSGGILRSPASLRLLSDCLGRDIRICSEMESSLRGAAIYALRRLGLDPKPLPRGALVRCRVALAKKHRARRAR